MKTIVAFAACLLAAACSSDGSNVSAGSVCASDDDCSSPSRCVDGRCSSDRPDAGYGAGGGATGGRSGGGGIGGGTGAAGGANSGGATATGCTVDTECEARLLAATPTPSGCAEARCDSTTGLCEFRSRDQDGDGERAAACAASVTVQTGPDCDDRPGAGASIRASASEVCDAARVDENCNGMVDEGCSCAMVGATEPCCGGRGAQTCEAVDGGATVLSACNARVSAEICNGVDDDCNGAVDDAVVIGGLDGGLPDIDGGVVEADGACTVGVGACARTGTLACSSARLVCSETAGDPAAEICNGADDDCDGQADEPPTGAEPALCAIAGQRCAAGACACPGAQTECGTSCQLLGGACSVGTGACATSGEVVCRSGGPACSVTAGTPSTELCDDIDNDCDGETDEGMKVDCNLDNDNDGYQTDANVVGLCADASRPGAGSCPTGYVSPATSRGQDCQPGSASAHTLASTRADADGDGRCIGAASSTCVGAAAPSGRRFADQCAGEDCNDDAVTAYQAFSVRTDSDGDGYCTGATYTACAAEAPPAGTRTSCSGDDCNDGAPTAHESFVLRTDGDNDGYCVGGSFSLCAASPPFGTRVASSCAGEDCKDDNAQATTTCRILNAYASTYVSKPCAIGPPPCESRFAQQADECPPGFAPSDFHTEVNSPANCTAVSYVGVTACCGGIVFGTVSCRVRGDCVAE